MKMKQKVVMIVATFGLAIGFLAVMPTSSVMAQSAPVRGTDDPDVNSGTGGTEGTDGTDTDDTDASEKKCGGVETSILECPDDDKEGGTIMWLLTWVLKIMTAGVGIAAVGGIAYGALLYTTAESKPEQTKKAIGIITNVVIGLVAYALMAVFLNFLIPGGVFQ